MGSPCEHFFYPLKYVGSLAQVLHDRFSLYHNVENKNFSEIKFLTNVASFTIWDLGVKPPPAVLGTLGLVIELVR